MASKDELKNLASKGIKRGKPLDIGGDDNLMEISNYKPIKSEKAEKKVRTSASADPELMRRIKLLAVTRGESVQTHVDEAIRRYLVQEEGQ